MGETLRDNEGLVDRWVLDVSLRISLLLLLLLFGIDREAWLISTFFWPEEGRITIGCSSFSNNGEVMECTTSSIPCLSASSSSWLVEPREKIKWERNSIRKLSYKCMLFLSMFGDGRLGILLSNLYWLDICNNRNIPIIWK